MGILENKVSGQVLDAIVGRTIMASCTRKSLTLSVKKWPNQNVIPIVSSNFSRHGDSTATEREYPELETAIGISYAY